jgi:hypothetical protein
MLIVKFSDIKYVQETMLKKKTSLYVALHRGYNVVRALR